MSSKTQRGRRVAARSRPSLMPFYLALGAIAIIGAAVLFTMLSRGTFGGSSASVEGIPVGVTSEGYFYKGSESAPLTVTEFSDFQCPGCGIFALRLFPGIAEQYVKTGQMRLVYRDFPLINIHPNAVAAAEAARCAGAQSPELFWKMHDLLFQNQSSWSSDAQPATRFASYAEQANVDMSAYNACIAGGEQRAIVLRALSEPGPSQGVQGTPSFEVNGRYVFAEELVTAIEAALR